MNLKLLEYLEQSHQAYNDMEAENKMLRQKIALMESEEYKKCNAFTKVRDEEKIVTIDMLADISIKHKHLAQTMRYIFILW